MENNVVDYYTNTFNEHFRHLDAFGKIQQRRTLQLLKKYLLNKQKVIDIGGATGVYSFELAKCGHEVHLFDIVPIHIEKARKVSAETGIALHGFHVGDAQDLAFPDNTFDAVIVHGPLYHITDENSRLRVLKEAYRVLKPGGILFAFAINRYAGVFYGIKRELILDDAYFDMVSHEVKTGLRTRSPSWHFHLPEEMDAEVAKADFKHIEIKGVVGPIWMLPDVERRLEEAETQQKILRVSELLENEPIIGQDFVCIARKS
ncbi:class I SAM-dependent methyltransferase [Candidatus Symbiopectobacterium sp. NZEC127]|uniref:class I SAM-dependent methyltransferase n=1 Tax=Candidatus Symbiopectobacterium sp. NZEC127 TaxID=2820472 RepID=UPI002226DC77|nr:class I SAM-dependent methyltransferase [Candidatus Symbiopectobacterium sp. NZEC127]MCW2484591.1 class I SAM-dependent methyltransferase [Candidatus Symbiopectobacterium sp. NZEC127]